MIMIASSQPSRASPQARRHGRLSAPTRFQFQAGNRRWETNPPDDVKSAAGDVYTFAKQHLRLTGWGNDQQSFARSTLVPRIKPGMAVYEQLKKDIFF
ncbi:hypothetical protein BREVUG8_110031 [Brevundimonas sp. G8]|nr:hypothetical protein BREVUG8_110031 [Brevundimonas sp. G8]